MKLWLLMILMCGGCSGSHILVFYPGGSGSLLRSFNHLFQELSRRGHDITMITAYKQPGLNENITQILLGYKLNRDTFKRVTSLPLVLKTYNIWDISIAACEGLFKTPKMIQVLNANQMYDLFIGSPFYYSECTVAVAHHLKLPILNIFSNRMHIHFTHLVGQLFPYSYIADFDLPFGNSMNFWQRTVNTMFCLGYSLGLSFYYIPQIDAIVKRNFPHLPPLHEMLAQVPVTLLNTNIALHPSQPLLPGVVPVGGLTIPQNVTLPEELQVWMDASDHGVILLSFGSNMNVTMVDPLILNMFLAVFNKLPQRVLMKWEADHLDKKPSNVRLAKWIPQTAVLANPHCRLFITHGGLHSWMEAVYYSVPLLGLMDTILDQTHNLIEMQEKGHGLHFTGPWTEDIFYKAVREVLHNKKYKDNIKKASRVFSDQPMSPLQTAVYWTEYVIRHKGAPHLQSAASSLSWYQLVLLDIITFLVLCVVISVIFTYVIIRCVKRHAVDHKFMLFNHTLKSCDKLKTKTK